MCRERTVQVAAADEPRPSIHEAGRLARGSWQGPGRRGSMRPESAMRTGSIIDEGQSMTRGRMLGYLAAVALLAIVPATACPTTQDAPRPTPDDSASGLPPRLRFETVRAILQDSKGNYWFGSWNQGVCRF